MITIEGFQLIQFLIQMKRCGISQFLPFFFRHRDSSQVFVPTAIKFHYIFNLRDLSNVFQGLLFATNDCIGTPTEIVRLWCHEIQRVYMDKMADNKDIENFEKIQKDILKKQFDDVPEPEVLGKPLIYCHFAK